MSKYIYELTELICDAVKTVFPNASFDDEYDVADYVIAKLSTIEVSEERQEKQDAIDVLNAFTKAVEGTYEDCISRAYLEEQLQQIEDITAMAHIDLGEDPYDETEEITMPISTVRKIFKNAPSVLPKANKNEWIEEFSDDGWRWVKDEL